MRYIVGENIVVYVSESIKEMKVRQHCTPLEDGAIAQFWQC